MQLNVVKLCGNSYAIAIEAAATVEQLKANIAAREQISATQIKLIFHGKALSGGFLRDLGIADGASVHLVIQESKIIRVAVQIPDGRPVTLDVEPNEAVYNFKKMIFERHSRYVVERQILHFNEREIKDGRLSHHGVREGSTLRLSLGSIQIFVRDFQGKTHTFANVQHDCTVGQFKNMVSKKTGVPASQLRLSYSGKQLGNDRDLLSHYGIQDNGTVEMLGRLRGG